MEEDLGTETLVGKQAAFSPHSQLVIILMALVFCVMDSTEVLWLLEFLRKLSSCNFLCLWLRA